MCAHFETVSKSERLKVSFNVDMPEGAKSDVWPGHMGLFIRRPKQEPENESQALSREAMVGTFGLIPHWANDTLLAKRTLAVERQLWAHSCHLSVSSERLRAAFSGPW